MANHYRVRLRLTGPLATPMHSGTIFGHLCWAYRAQHGDAALTRWLDELPEQPFLISDAFPADQLPRPLLPRVKPEDPAQRLSIQELNQLKPLTKRPHIPATLFLQLRSGISEHLLLAALWATSATKKPAEARQAHNTINRLTGTTPEAGGLYFSESEWFEAGHPGLDVYVSTDMPMAGLQELFDKVGKWGFGKDASVGRGGFTAMVEPADARLFKDEGNRRMSLSHGTLESNMTGALYKLHTHYGKTGSTAAMSGNPFKYPLTLLQPGATFTPQGPGPFGRLLSAVHPNDPRIRQNAWHLTLAYTEVD